MGLTGPGGAGVHGNAGDAPFEDAGGGPAGDQAAGGEQPDGVVGEHAVLAAAVGADLAIAGQLGEPWLEFLQRDVDGAG